MGGQGTVGGNGGEIPHASAQSLCHNLRVFLFYYSPSGLKNDPCSPIYEFTCNGSFFQGDHPRGRPGHRPRVRPQLGQRARSGLGRVLTFRKPGKLCTQKIAFFPSMKIAIKRPYGKSVRLLKLYISSFPLCRAAPI